LLARPVVSSISTATAQNVAGHKYGTVWLGNQGQQFLTTVPGALVSKIGFTDAAQHTYLCAASRGGRRLGVIFLRAQKYPIDQWQQAAELLDWGYALPRGTSVGHLQAPAAPAAPFASANAVLPRIVPPTGSTTHRAVACSFETRMASTPDRQQEVQ